MNYTAATYSNINPALFYGGGFCGGVDPRREQYAGEDVAGVEVPNYKTKYEALKKSQRNLLVMENSNPSAEYTKENVFISNIEVYE